MSEEQNRFSLRKLTVGLASVLIGVSIFGTSQTVKADTVADQNTSTVTSNAQSSDTQENKNVAKSSFSNDNQANNAKSNLIQTQDEGKKDQTDSLNQNPTNSQEANDSNDLQEKSAEKSIVGSSSAQKINNQSSDHADDNSQTQLDITKNSQQLNQKELATNLIQDNSAQQDISKITDPSKIDASHFADGTRWTPVGWTRADKNTKIAKSSDYKISFVNSGGIDSKTGIYKETQGDPVWIHADKITFTIDKNDMAQKGRILIGAIQLTPTNEKQNLVYGKHTDPTLDLFGNGVNDSTYVILDQNRKQIGWLSNEIAGTDEIDTWFNITTPIKNLAIDPTFTFTFPNRNFVVDVANNGSGDYSHYYSAKNNNNYPLHNSVVTKSSILNYETNFDSNKYKTISNLGDDSGWSIYPDNVWGQADQDRSNLSNQSNPSDMPSKNYFVFKVKALQGQQPTAFNVFDTTSIYIYDANGKMTSEFKPVYRTGHSSIQKADNLSAIDLYNATSDDQVTCSKQADGSYLLCIKTSPKSGTTKSITDAVKASYVANIQDPKHYDQILANTLKNTKSWGTIHRLIAFNIPLTSEILNIIDVTPNSIHPSHLNSFNITSNTSSGDGGQGQGNIETYKNVKISYVDDDDNSKSVSSDAMTGRQNKASTYTVNIPKGYYLDDNNTSKGYTWNADHTQITYTFNTDQAKNDANPIEIHLKHQLQDVSATDPKAKQDNRYRMIENLPDGTKKTIIDLEIESHRTATKDLVTGKTTYSDWISKDAVFTNRTNNGGSGDPSFIWKVPLDWFDNCTRTFSIPNGYEKVEQNDHTFYTSLEKDNNGSFLINFISYPDGGVGLDFEVDVPKNNTTTYKAMPANCDFVINYQHNTQKVTDPSQLQTTGKRTITIKMPKGHGDQMTIVQTVGYKRTGTLDLYTGTATYTDWVFDADTSNVTVDGQPSTQYQAYVLKDGVVNYAPIKLPHINGYKTKLIQDKANPAMFMVSFMAVPTENKPSTPVEVAPSKPSANADNPNHSAWTNLDHKVVDVLNQSDSGWTMPNTQPATYTVEAPADDAIIDLSDLVIAEPVHAQTRTQIRVTKRFKLRKHGKKHVAKHLKHRKKAVKSFKKYRL